MTSPEVAEALCAAGADALGLVFYPPSVRAISAERASEVVSALSPLVSAVGLFVDPSADAVEAVLQRCELDCLQFHGAESAAFCEQFNRPYIKAISMRADLDMGTTIAASVSEHKRARAFLFDSWRENMPGGTGEVFSWDRIPAMRGRAWILAGGLHANNVGAAIAKVRPPAVDVSGGVEREAGVKDVASIGSFIAAVRAADAAADAQASIKHGC